MEITKAFTNKCNAICHPHFLRQRKLFFRPVPQGDPSGWLHVKNLPHALRERIFHGKPCRRPPKNKLEKAQEIRMPTRVGDV